MTKIYSEFRSTSASCPECSSSVVLRIQMAESATGEVSERSRREECTSDRSHRLAALTV